MTDGQNYRITILCVLRTGVKIIGIATMIITVVWCLYRSASVPVHGVQQGVHAALFVGVTLSQGPRSRVPFRTQTAPRQSLRVRGVWPHDWTSRATLRSSQTATSVQSGTASSPRQALLQVHCGHWITSVRQVPDAAVLARLDLCIAQRYLVYSHTSSTVMITRVLYAHQTGLLMLFPNCLKHSILSLLPVCASE